jgi:predicted permease
MKANDVLLLAVDPKMHRYPSERTRRLLTELRERLTGAPGIRSITFLDSLPLSIGGSATDFTTDSGITANGDLYQVGSNFFLTMGIPLRRGRDFVSGHDRADVAVINETLAQRLFGDQDPIGRQMAGRRPANPLTVIGVAANTKSRTLGEQPRGVAYLFLEPQPDNVMSFYGISVAVKTTDDPRRFSRAVRDHIAALDPNLAVFNVMTMEEHVRKSLLIPSLCAELLTICGIAGLTLAAIGLYGVVSYSVRRRTREFGVRMALGAREGAVLRMVIREGISLALIGMVAGLAIAATISRYAAALLYGVDAFDTTTFVVVPAVLLSVALLAIVIPGRHAAQVQPATALRYD